MASDGLTELDPKEIARTAFPTAFRGYDTEAVRQYLSRLATTVGRAQHLGLLGPDAEAGDRDLDHDVDTLQHENADLHDRIAELEARLDAAGSELTDARAAASAPADTDLARSEPLDEADLISQLGQETARIVEAARSAAADIVQRAEDEAVSIKAQATVDVRAAREQADDARAAAKAEADQIIAAARIEAEQLEARLVADAEGQRAKAVAESNRTVGEAAAKAESGLAAARQRSTQLVAEAEQMRDKVLGDLVRRRRLHRTQIEELETARNRLAAALAGARTELEDVAGVLEAAEAEHQTVEQQRKARAKVRRPEPTVDLTGAEADPIDAEAEVAELVAQLQHANGNGASPPLAAGTDAEVARDLDELFSLDDTMPIPVISDGDAATESGDDENNDEPRSGEPPHPAPAGDLTTDPQANTEPESELESRTDHGNPTGPGGDDSESPAAGAVTAGEPTATTLTDLDGPIDGDRLLDQLGFAPDVLLGSEAGELERSATRGDLPRSTPYGGRLPAPFEARDVALTRSTPSFRRKLKRAVNDDQSDVLDRLRAGRGAIGAEELPPLDDQLDRYVAALRPGLTSVVEAGCASLDSDDVPTAAVENLSLQLAKHIVDCLRLPSIGAIEDAPDADREAILDPIRAVYRQFRNTNLADLIDDALHEAYALGLYAAIDRDQPVVWLTDPRLDPDPICEENSASAPLAKGASFPSGHARPLSMPGCRCLATPLKSGG